MSETTLPDLEFENREYELGRIASPAGPSFIVVDAPPEYGKTYLLEKVKTMYESPEREWGRDWKCVKVDLDDPRYENGRRAILEAISFPVANQRMRSHNAAELAEHIAGQDKNVLILFDAADCREQETKWLVQEVIPELVDILRLPRKTLRVVFAGRYISRRGWPWPNYTPITLSEFSDEVVQKMILRLKPDLGLDEARMLAREITFLSGGHPGSVKKILQDLVSHNWAISFDHRGCIQPPRRRRELFGHANDNARKIIEHMPDELQETLKTLSIFRRFNVNTIQALQMREDISGIRSSFQPLDLFAQLTNTGLLRSPVQGDPFYSDGIIRSLLLAQMQFKDPTRYLALNQLACEIYDAWIESKDLDGNGLRGTVLGGEQVTYMVEGFYHFLHCPEEGPSLSEVEDKLRYYIPKLKSAFGDSSEIAADLKQQLGSSLCGDQDIRRRLRDLFGEAEANALLDRVFHDQEQ